MVSKNYSIVDKIKTEFLKKWKFGFLDAISKKQKKSSNIIISFDTYNDLLDELEEINSNFKKSFIDEEVDQEDNQEEGGNFCEYNLERLCDNSEDENEDINITNNK